jgi:hypothetical protein
MVTALIAPYIAITLAMSGDCINGGYCSWDLYRPTQGFRDIVIFNTTSADIWDVDSFHPIGLHNWRAGAAVDVADVDRAQNSPYSDVRLRPARGSPPRGSRALSP